MSSELQKEKIVLTQSAGNESTQVLLEGDIIVPDIKPDMALILKTDADICFDKTEISSDRVNFSGKLTLKVLYLAKGPERPVHSITVVSPVNDFVNMEGVTRDMWVDIGCSISNITYKMLNDRKINYRAVIDVKISAEAKTEHQIVSGISGGAEQRRCKLSLNKTIEKKEDCFIVKDELAIPLGKPSVREILQTCAVIANKDVKISNGRVNISGEILVSTFYRGDNEESIIEFVEHELSFNGTVDAFDASEGMHGDVSLRVSDIYTQVKTNDDGEDRVIETEVDIMAVVKVTAQTELEILEDAYCVDSNLILDRESVCFPQLVCRNKNQCPVKESVAIEDNCPDILQILRANGNVLLDEIKTVADKVIVEGIIDVDILYIAKNDDAPLFNYKTTLPFKQAIETKGAEEGMRVRIHSTIAHVGFNMLSEREMELRFLLGFNTQVIDSRVSSVITDVEFRELDRAVWNGMPSMTIYVVQKGDTLWSIAKKYNTTIAELLKINDIEDSDRILPGQKLLVLKKITA